MSRLGGFNPNTSHTYWPTTCHVFSFYNFLPYIIKLKPKTGKKKNHNQQSPSKDVVAILFVLITFSRTCGGEVRGTREFVFLTRRWCYYYAAPWMYYAVSCFYTSRLV